MIKILLGLLLLLIFFMDAAISFWGTYKCFKINYKIVGCLFGLNGLLSILGFILTIIKMSMI